MAYAPIRSADDLTMRVKLGETTESRVLDFKAELATANDGRRNWQHELALDIVQFANTEGGTLLVGVEESRETNPRVAKRLRAVEDVERVKCAVADALCLWTEPRVNPEVIAIQAAETVVAINVPPSIPLVAVWRMGEDGNRIQYPFRTEHGKRYMTPSEVEQRIMDGSRAIKLALKRVAEECDLDTGAKVVELIPALQDEAGVGLAFPLHLRRLLEHEIELQAQGMSFHVPYSLIEAAWVTATRRPGLCLKVKATLAREGVVLTR